MPTATLDKPKATRTWRKLLCSLPGYDPFVQAEGCCFDAGKAQFFIDYIEKCCTHIEGELAGSAFLLENWQKAIVANLFGWLRRDMYSRTVRRYRTAFIYVARKNGKTPLGAALMNAVFFLDDEAGQQNYCAAADIDQASLAFRHILGMVNGCDEMRERVRDYVQTKTIQSENDLSYIKVLSKEPSNKDGGNPHIILIDELHALPDRRVVDKLTTSMASKNRAQPLIVYLTTADLDRPSICNEVYEEAVAVRDNPGDPNAPGYDPTFLPVIYEVLPKDDWTSEKTWEKANPNLDVSVSREYLRSKCQKARNVPAYENTFKRLHLNLRTEQEERWIQIELWDENAGPVDREQLRGQVCYAGLDMSSTSDMTASGRLFPPTDECPVYRYFCRLYIPADTAGDREIKERVPIRQWAKEGFVTLTPGRVVNHAVVLADLEKDAELYDMRKLAVDRWQADTIMRLLVDHGFDEDKVSSCGQGYQSLSAPTKALLELLLEKKLAHGGDPVLRWMAGNVAVEMDPAENIKPVKNKYRTRWKRIDGIVALIMCLREALIAAEPEISVYEERGMRSV